MFYEVSGENARWFDENCVAIARCFRAVAQWDLRIEYYFVDANKEYNYTMPNGTMIKKITTQTHKPHKTRKWIENKTLTFWMCCAIIAINSRFILFLSSIHFKARTHLSKKRKKEMKTENWFTFDWFMGRERGRDRWPFIQRLAYHKRMANEHTFWWHSMHSTIVRPVKSKSMSFLPMLLLLSRLWCGLFKRPI